MWLQHQGLESADLEADDDRDSLSTLMEYAFGLDPMAFDAAGLPPVQIMDGHYVVRFTEPPGVSGLVYGAEWSATLQPGSWRELPDVGITPLHEFRLPTGTTPKIFLRLKVTGE
jgi:hypothetical protein